MSPDVSDLKQAGHAEPAVTPGSRADYSVSVETHGGWVYVAEFRTWQEAVELAESAVERSGLRVQIRQYGETKRDLQPEAVATR